MNFEVLLTRGEVLIKIAGVLPTSSIEPVWEVKVETEGMK